MKLVLDSCDLRARLANETVISEQTLKGVIVGAQTKGRDLHQIREIRQSDQCLKLTHRLIFDHVVRIPTSDGHATKT